MRNPESQRIRLIVAGVLLWLINTHIPMEGKLNKILNLVMVLWLLNVFGVWGHRRDIRTSVPSPTLAGTIGSVVTQSQVPL